MADKNSFYDSFFVDTEGRKKAGELADRNHISMATTITEERLKLLGKDFKGAHIQIEDMYTDNKPSGTAIVIKLPLILS